MELPRQAAKLASVDDDVGDDDVEVDTDHESSLSPEQLGLGLAPPLSIADRLGDGLARLEAVRNRPVVVAGLVSCLVAALVAVPLARSPADPVVVDDLIPQVALTPTSAVEAELANLIVHVSGAVIDPGVYTLPPSARVIDAVDAAGGVATGADLHQLNLAAPVIDGQQVRVPMEGEVLPPASAGTGNEPGPIDLNLADEVALQALAGVGPATAEAIVAHRNEHGRFQTVDDLLDVPGIGPAKLAAIADAVVVR